jgi:hypothetical protein
MENVSLIFETLLDATDNNASELIKSHHEIWESFATIAPLLRSRRKFTIREQEDLILDTKEFGMRYKEKSSSNITYKMHLLFAHLEDRLKTYRTIGLFSEDSMESIHAVVNRLDRVYASLDSERKTKAILQSLEATKKRSLTKQSTQIIESLKKGEVKEKKKRRQGVGKATNYDANIADDFNMLASAATESLRNWNWISTDVDEPDYPASHLIYEEVPCEHCLEHLGVDVKISSQLMELHYLIKHHHTEDKQNVSKK